MANKSIIIVEDDLDDQEFALQALESCGLRESAETFADGVAALEFLAREGAAEAVTLLLLDLMMPKLGGLQVLERLRAEPRTALLRVVVFSSSAQPVDVQSAYRLGASSYVRKPVDPEEYAAAVAQTARYWAQRNIAPDPVAWP